jgi:uncharacterized protein (TIGR02246 family)
MAQTGARSASAASQDLEITRVFDAPRDVVWKAWTDREQAVRWWGPRGFKLPYYEIDIRQGGKWRVCMRAPDGEEHWAHGLYKEIVEHHRLVYTWVWEKGRQDEKLITVKFFALDGKTKLSFHLTGLATTADRDAHREGWTETLDHLAEYLRTGNGEPDDEAQIRALLDSRVEAIRAKDLGRLMAHQAPDVVAFDLIEPLEKVGSDGVRQRAEDWFASFEGPIDFEIRDVEITAGDDVAFSHCLAGVRGTRPDGERVEMWWRSTLCYRKAEGEWQITHEHDSVPVDMESGKALVDLRP